MRKKDLALEVINRLEKEYPDAGCTLDYNNAWKLLISVRLAAQCTDEKVLNRFSEQTILLHPLPRNAEIATDVDDDPRALYFKQAHNGMWVRMALLYDTILNG